MHNNTKNIRLVFKYLKNPPRQQGLDQIIDE